MEQFGLIDHWWRTYSPADPTPCLPNNIADKKKTPKTKEEKAAGDRKRLSLKDLSGAFVLLIAGYILSSLVLIIERSIGRMKKDYQSRNQIATLMPNNNVVELKIIKNIKKSTATVPLPKMIADLPTSTSGDFKVSIEEIDNEITVIDPRTKPTADSHLLSKTSQDLKVLIENVDKWITSADSLPTTKPAELKESIVKTVRIKTAVKEIILVKPKTKSVDENPSKQITTSSQQPTIAAAAGDLNEMIKEIENIKLEEEIAVINPRQVANTQ